MEDQDELFLDLSLESVVQKAEELESVLRSAKNHAWSTTGDEERDLEYHPYRGEGLVTAANGFSFPSPVLSPRTENAFQAKRTPTDVAPYWQNLTSYIVSLEKELQYYKLLVEDTQQMMAAQRNGTSAKDELLSSKVDVPNGSNGTIKMESHDDKEQPSSVAEQVKKSTTNDSEHYWHKLIEDDSECSVLFLVFSYLSTAELCRASCVCHKWYTISKHPQLWKRVTIEETVITPQVLSTISQWCTQTEFLTLHGLMPDMASCDEDLQTYITRTRGCLETALTKILVRCSQSLLSLTITECNLMITDHMLWIVSIHCPNLKAFSYCSDEFPPSSESLWSLTNGCPQLQHLNLPPVLGSPNASAYNDVTLTTIAHNWTNLLSLVVGGKFITRSGLLEISMYCRELRYLEIIHGPDFDKDTIESLCQDGGLSSLNSLVLNYTPSSRVAIEYLIEHCPNLTTVYLHITLSLYFPDSSDSSDIATYERIVSKLRSLEKNSKGKNVFHLFEHYYGDPNK